MLIWYMSALPLDLRRLGDMVEDAANRPEAKGFGQLRAVDFTRPEDAVYVPESQGLSGMVFLRLALGDDR
jgi:hypothetical protein